MVTLLMMKMMALLTMGSMLVVVVVVVVLMKVMIGPLRIGKSVPTPVRPSTITRPAACPQHALSHTPSHDITHRTLVSAAFEA